MTEERPRLIDTVAGRLAFAIVLVIGILIIVFALAEPSELPENCRMRGKVVWCEEPTPTPTDSWWRITGPRDTFTVP